MDVSADLDPFYIHFVNPPALINWNKSLTKL